ncbi:unnamed protein product [Musa acuminata subsp. malaccensis]|uniref:(wild Malaysian banana) hypothetical protein n=1 Tax=Musa acuminata subsp. malaccensis TaxID=214687 RepID=A0A804ICJ6_MUSAM|nr:unnamed protein product [Musa acuminata subsp. malaccensis]
MVSCAKKGKMLARTRSSVYSCFLVHALCFRRNITELSLNCIRNVVCQSPWASFSNGRRLLPPLGDFM